MTLHLRYYSVVLCILCSSVHGERCPTHCTQDGHLRPRQDCGPRGLCCGWQEDMYCCVSYFDRIDLSRVTDVTECIGAEQRAGSPSSAASHVLLVGLAAYIGGLGTRVRS